MSPERNFTVHSNGKGKFVSGHTINIYGVVQVQLQVFLNSAQHEGKWLASCPGRFAPWERDPSTYHVECWMGPRTSVNALEKRQISWPPRESRYDSSVVRSVAYSLHWLSYFGHCTIYSTTLNMNITVYNVIALLGYREILEELRVISGKA
jgi:hypothetical protein